MKYGHLGRKRKRIFGRFFQCFLSGMNFVRKIKQKKWKLLDSPENPEHNARWWLSLFSRLCEAYRRFGDSAAWQ
jgi:hypothetical protein